MTGSQRPAVLAVAAFYLIGFALLTGVKDTQEVLPEDDPPQPV